MREYAACNSFISAENKLYQKVIAPNQQAYSEYVLTCVTSAI